jgi:ABC-type sugar transport system ATPase subunit
LNSPLLKLTGVSKSFGGVQALADVSFDLLPGEVHALVGENGAGKSTLVKIITGAHAPDMGTIELFGQRVTDLDPQQARDLGIAAIYQQPALFPDLTVAENIAFGVEPPGFWRRIDWRKRRQRAMNVLEDIGARIDPGIDAGRLTMPQQQLVEIAKALAAEARILILDEPTASLSDSEIDHLFTVIDRLKSQGVGLVYISHRLDELPRIADRVTALRDGRLVGTAPLTEVSRADLVRMMVGRELSTIFPTRVRRAEGLPASPPLSPPYEGGEELAAVSTDETLLEARGVSPDFLPHSKRGTERLSSDSPPLRKGGPGGVSSDVIQHPKADASIGETLLEARRVSCGASAVRDVNLAVRVGEIVGLAGLVGAGRTELARILFGLTPADEGEILIRGKRVVIDSPTRARALGIAYVPEDRRRHGVILDLSVAANTSLALLPTMSRHGLFDFRLERELAESFASRLRVKAPSIDVPAGNLSGGNQQKVALARWLATNPSVLILDEPTQGIDVGSKAEIHRLMGELAAQGLGILMISSDLPEILGMSDRIAVMHAGTIVGELDRSEATQERVLDLALGHVHGGNKAAIDQFGPDISPPS